MSYAEPDHIITSRPGSLRISELPKRLRSRRATLAAKGLALTASFRCKAKSCNASVLAGIESSHPADALATCDDWRSCVGKINELAA